MACISDGRNCFTFIWKLENASYCLQKKGELIESPKFQVDEIEKTKWALRLYPRGCQFGNYVGFFLYRDIKSEGAMDVEVNYELSFLAKSGSVLISSVFRNVFAKGDEYGHDKFVKRGNVFLTKRLKFLPQETLTVRCKMWKNFGEFLKNVSCSAHTRIGVEKRSFSWEIENFSTLETDKKCTYLLNSLVDNKQLISLDFSVTGGLNFEEIIRFEFTLLDQTIKFATVCVCLVNASGNEVQCNQDEFWFDIPARCKQFSFHFTKRQLMAKKSYYLPDDILSLYWDWVFSKGIVPEGIEEIEQGCTRTESQISDTVNINNETMPSSLPLNVNLKSLCDGHLLCDVELQTSTSTFPAHKVILSASSSVFKAMFSNDMKEKDGDFFNIEDLSDDAVHRMLLYIYTARVENLTWETASHLYVAADRYAVLSLKSVCSAYLTDNLSPSNACKVLLLSDFHADGILKSAVQDYILKHVKDVVNSGEWQLLMETNAKLAAETMCLQYK